MQSSPPDPKPLFSSAAFSFLEGLSSSPTKAFYSSHKNEFVKEVQEPLKNLFKLVEQRLPQSMLDELETKTRIMSQILKNDFGVGGAHDYLWGAFYKKGEKRIASPQLFITIAKDHFGFGFYIGEDDQVFQRTFAHNCKRPEIRSLGKELDAALVGMNIKFGARKPNHPIALDSFHEFASFGDWFDNVDEVGAGARVILTKDEVINIPSEQLADMVASVFKKLFPLFQIANNQNKTLILEESISEKKELYGRYLNRIHESKATASHYIRSLDTLCDILKSETFGFNDCANMWSLDKTAISRLEELLAYLKEQQKLGTRSPLAQLDIPKYYLKDRFFHAAVSNYIDFLANNNSQSDLKHWTWAAGENASRWEEFYEAGIMAIGWDILGDLRQYKSKQEIKNKLQELGGDADTSSKKNDVLACWEFANEIQVGDIIFSKKGNKQIVGYGIVEGEYSFDPSRESFKHTRKVKWVKNGNWNMPEGQTFTIKTLTDISGYSVFVKQVRDLVGIQSEASSAISITTNPHYSVDQCSVDSGFPKEDIDRWVRSIHRKGQAIVYGAPGTGKTFIAEKLSKHLIGGGDGFYDLVQFHPAYSYEDFIEGIRPVTIDGKLSYSSMAGRFLDFCNEARKRNDICVLIIDEINRANLSRVFGELMYLLEYRNKEIVLASGAKFSIPENIRIIGTMNTADRSIALVDHALRRRFSFISLSPNYEVLTKFFVDRDFDPTTLIDTLKKINNLINDKHFHIGISFFLRDDLEDHLEDVWQLEIEPYLEEFFFDQLDKLEPFRWSEIQNNLISR
jgi:hypothetical protein